MSTQQRGTRVPSLAKSIDSVLDTPPAQPSTRPTTTLRPSWIGPPRPERPVTPGLQIMKQSVTIQHSSPGLQPPVFIFTNLSDPQWEAIEMDRKDDGHGGFIFSKTFQVDEGEYQYKFRLGEGDWWTCDESKTTVDDGQGNKNNLLVVKSESPLGLRTPSPSPEIKVLPGTSKALDALPLPKPQLQSSAVSAGNEKCSTVAAPLLKHEAFDSHQGSATEQTPEREERNPFEVDEEEPTESRAHDVAEHGRSLSPLLRHESVKPLSIEQEHAPLFRHESISLGNNDHERAAPEATPTKTSLTINGSPPVPAEAEPRDHLLERFPSDHAGIMEKIQHTHKRLPEDETSDHSDIGSPMSQAVSESSLPMPSLPVVHESEEEELENIREAEEEQVEKEEATGEEVDPLKPSTHIETPEADEADFEPKIAVMTEKVDIEETIIIEVFEGKKGWFEALLDRLGGQGNALAMAMGLLTIAAGICAMQFL